MVFFCVYVWPYIDGDRIGEGEDGQARKEGGGEEDRGREGGEREEESRGEDGGMKEEGGRGEQKGDGRREEGGDGRREEGGEGKRDETRGGLQEWRGRKNEEDSGGPRYTHIGCT